jgi:hypothetical protein
MGVWALLIILKRFWMLNVLRSIPWETATQLFPWISCFFFSRVSSSSVNLSKDKKVLGARLLCNFMVKRNHCALSSHLHTRTATMVC